MQTLKFYEEIDGYKVVDGTYYDMRTPMEVIQRLELARKANERIRIFYGDVETGKCWNDEYDTIGRVGRSSGKAKIPILIKNSRSLGGSSILDSKIVRIDIKDSHGDLITVYKNYVIHFDTFVSTDIGTVYNETKDEIYARCKDAEAGKRLAAFMNGTRWSK